MRIGLDVMGGDHAPHSNLDGAVAALEQFSDADELWLFGDETAVRDGLRRDGADLAADDRVHVVATSQTIAMDDGPVEAVRNRPDSSIVRMAEYGSRRKCSNHGLAEPLDAVLSAGNTGAMVAAAQMCMRRLRYVHRPGICVTIPTFAGPMVMCDVGANIEPKASHLAQYGLMGEVYAREIVGIEHPRVALMNVGGEEGKGTAQIREARDVLRDVPNVQFTGFVEGRGAFDGEADVVVTDGVVGNVMLKLAEGLSAGIFRAIAREVARIDPELAQRFQPVVQEIYAQHDYHEYGAAPLLGVDGTCLISHGSSEARGITNAILRARKYGDVRINEKLVAGLAAIEEAPA